MLRAIACIGKNRELGKNNTLCFHIKEDMNLFKVLTNRQIVVMGYNTLLSLPHQKPLKDRTTILICPEGVERDDCIVYHDFDKMVKDVQLLAQNTNVWVIGGAMLYESMLPYCDYLHLTEVDAEMPDATVYFPEFINKYHSMIPDEYKEEFKEENGIKYQFNIYERNSEQE